MSLVGEGLITPRASPDPIPGTGRLPPPHPPVQIWGIWLGWEGLGSAVFQIQYLSEELGPAVAAVSEVSPYLHKSPAGRVASSKGAAARPLSI